MSGKKLSGRKIVHHESVHVGINSGTDKEDILGPVKRICVFEHSVMTNFNCPCPAIQRGQGSGFLSEGSS